MQHISRDSSTKETRRPKTFFPAKTDECSVPCRELHHQKDILNGDIKIWRWLTPVTWRTNSTAKGRRKRKRKRNIELAQVGVAVSWRDSEPRRVRNRVTSPSTTLRVRHPHGRRWPHLDLQRRQRRQRQRQMPPLSAHKPSLIPPTFQYPLKLCFATTLTTWVLSLITGNVSQVDRLWTFLPTIYTAYWALLPLWPNENKSIGYLAPYVPERVVGEVVEAFHPRAVLMLALTVSIL